MVSNGALTCKLNSKRNANVCSDPVQSHYDEKFIHDNRSTSQNEIRAKCSLDICLSNCTVWYSLYTFLHTPPVSKTANVKTWSTCIQSNIANLICISFAVQYMKKVPKVGGLIIPVSGAVVKLVKLVK